MFGCFFVIELRLSICDSSYLNLDVHFNDGEAIGSSRLFVGELMPHENDLPGILETVEMSNSLATGFGKIWLFEFCCGYQHVQEKQIPIILPFHVKLRGRPEHQKYSRLSRDSFTPSYRATLQFSTIKRKIECEAPAIERAVWGDTEVDVSRTSLVDYVRHRTPYNAARYCPDLGLEEEPYWEEEIRLRTWWESVM